MPNDLCLVLMPFGKKSGLSGTLVDFDAIYRDLIAPAIADAGFEPVRGDEGMAGGLIHKSMFERLIFSKFVVADLTTADANVFYELGVRHAVRPWSTVLIFSKGGCQLPFDVAPLRALPYTLTPEGAPADPGAARGALSKRLAEARKAARQESGYDSPVYQLVENYPAIDHEEVATYRERVQYSSVQKRRLAAARKEGAEALRAAQQEMGDLGTVEFGVLLDLFLSYRSVKAWGDMISLVDRVPVELAATTMIQEQLALALNRAGRGEEAAKVLLDLIERRGPGGETYAILGRVYKDRWEASLKAGQWLQARGSLDKAIDAYLKGFEIDWRDAYPGINAVTLMELKEPPDPRRLEILPVVSYAVERRIAAGKPDYWDYATRLELAILAKDEAKAGQALGDALSAIREVWEPRTTVRNLRLVREARKKRGEHMSWAGDVEKELERWSF